MVFSISYEPLKITLERSNHCKQYVHPLSAEVLVRKLSFPFCNHSPSMHNFTRWTCKWCKAKWCLVIKQGEGAKCPLNLWLKRRWISRRFGWYGFRKASQRRDGRYWLRLLGDSREWIQRSKTVCKRCSFNQSYAVQVQVYRVLNSLALACPVAW